MVKKVKIIDIDGEFEDLENGFFNERHINIRTAVQHSANNPERISKLRAAQLGKKASKETKDKMSVRRQNQIGRPHTEKTKQKISAIKKGSPAPNKGVPHSAETRLKMSMNSGNKGKPAHNKGIPCSEEAKAKMSAAKKGIPKPKITCPHCNKTGGYSGMKQWHFDNCKFK
jgi:hypothetical protein